MSVKYSVNERINPLNPSAPKKWYANAHSADELTFVLKGNYKYTENKLRREQGLNERGAY